MGVTVATSATLVAQAASPSPVPAIPAKVTGPLDKAPVVNADPVPKDGSKPPVGPRGPSVSASALQSTSDKKPWDVTRAALEKVRKTRDSYDQARDSYDRAQDSYDQPHDESVDSAARAQLDRKWSALRDARDELHAAVKMEITALVGPNASPEAFDLARAELMDRAEGPDAKEFVSGAAYNIIRDLNAAHAERLLKTQYPNLKRTQDAFDAASRRLDAVDASRDGRDKVTGRVEELQKAAADLRAAWQSASEDANKGNVKVLQQACRVGLTKADQVVQDATAPVFVETRENPAYAYGLATYIRFLEAKAGRGGDVGAAALGFRDAWKAAVRDAETRDNAAYKKACQGWLEIAEGEVVQ
jgi:hypothetical protein